MSELAIFLLGVACGVGLIPAIAIMYYIVVVFISPSGIFWPVNVGGGKPRRDDV
jgi:hypothetical protein